MCTGKLAEVVRGLAFLDSRISVCREYIKKIPLQDLAPLHLQTFQHLFNLYMFMQVNLLFNGCMAIQIPMSIVYFLRICGTKIDLTDYFTGVFFGLLVLNFKINIRETYFYKYTKSI